MTGSVMVFDDTEIRASERALEAALESSDPRAWVFHYTEDAVFDAGGEHVVEGREALLAMADSMGRMSAVSIRPRRTEGSGHLATVWFDGGWTHGPENDRSRVETRGVILWRRDTDGAWRVALERLG